MTVMTIRIDDDIYYRLRARAAGANLSISKFLRPLIEDAVLPGGRYVYTSQDELLGVAIQSYAILAGFVSEQSPDALRRSVAMAQDMLRNRGLIGPDDDPFIDVVGATNSRGETVR